jgi:hypothetical protein
LRRSHETAAIVAPASFVSFAHVSAAREPRPALDPSSISGRSAGLANICGGVNDRQQVIGFSRISPFGEIHSFL